MRPPRRRRARGNKINADGALGRLLSAWRVQMAADHDNEGVGQEETRAWMQRRHGIGRGREHRTSTTPGWAC